MTKHVRAGVGVRSLYPMNASLLSNAGAPANSATTQAAKSARRMAAATIVVAWREERRVGAGRWEARWINSVTAVRAVRTEVSEPRRTHEHASAKTARSWCTRVNRRTHRASRVNKASSHRNEASRLPERFHRESLFLRRRVLQQQQHQ
mmetsp:Transcript_10491/g.34721  ORF Transcript_10491/g.34721 Transcript_10491/m.34721 type:complete len:149 (-) Transcript_10491:93-539(-)